MRVIDFNGYSHIINFDKDCRAANNQSKLHVKARGILAERFPMSSIYEEVTLTGCKGVGKTLVADLFIPHYPAIVEVHGQQHYSYSKFFHKSEAEFKKYKLNDEIKKEWAAINNIAYIELSYDTQDDWKEILYESL